LLQTKYVVGPCLSVCLLVTFMGPVKMAEPIEMLIGGQSQVVQAAMV